MTKYLDIRKGFKDEKIKEAAEIIKNGGLVVFPTETVYGIGANAFNEKAVKKIYEVKRRPFDKPISLLVNDLNMIEKVAKNITKLEYALIKKFCPGPITILLEKKEEIPDIVTANSNIVGVRIPENESALKLIQYAGVPIATPSANISGRPSGTNIGEIREDFEGKVDLFIDEGESKLGLASTIVQVIDEKPHILRQGVITKKEIEEIYLETEEKI